MQLKARAFPLLKHSLVERGELIDFEQYGLSDSDAKKLLGDGLMNNLGDVETIELVFNDLLAPLMYNDFLQKDTFLLLAYRLTLTKFGIERSDDRMLHLGRIQLNTRNY